MSCNHCRSSSTFVPLCFYLVELLEFSEDRHPWESIEEKLNAIRYEFFVFGLQTVFRI